MEDDPNAAKENQEPLLAVKEMSPANPVEKQMVPIMNKNRVMNSELATQRQQNLLQNNMHFNMPVLLKMFFPGSNIAINYNFNK